jgi:hypothetical protein
VFSILHVNEVDDDDAAEVTESQLAHDLDRCFEIEGEDGVFEGLGADVLAGVDVNRHQRLGLVDDQIASGFEPDLGSQDLFEFAVDAEAIHQIRGLSEELDPGNEAWIGLLEELQHLFEALLVVDPNL